MAAIYSSAEAARESINEIQVQIAKDKSRGWQKRAQKWAKGRKLLEKLLDDRTLGSEASLLTEWIENEFETATSSTDISLTVALLIHLVKHVYQTFLETSSFSIQEPHTLRITGKDQTDQLGALHFAGRIIVSLTELLLTDEMLNHRHVAFHVDLFIRIMEACIEGKIVHAQAHMNLGELLFSIVSNMENSECRTSEDSALGFAKIGKLLWKSQSSSITLYLLSILQSLLPAHAAGKDSPRTLACRKVVMNQGWSKDIIKESFNAIGKMDKKLYPDHLMKCINIFAQDRTILRPKAFQLTSFTIDDEDQITSCKSKKDLKDGHLALYVDRYCCRFILYGNDGHESPRIFGHTEVEDFARLDTKDGESTGFKFQTPSFDDHMCVVKFDIKTNEASDLETMLESVMDQRPQAFKRKAEKKASATAAGQFDPPAPAAKGADDNQKARFSSLARSISPRINTNETSKLQPGSKAYSSKSARPYKVRVPVDAVDEEDSTPTPQEVIKENEGDEMPQKAGKGEKMGKIKVKKPEWKAAESDADADWDEGGVSLVGKMSTPMTRSTKIYGSRGSRSSSSRRPMQPRLPPLPMESSDSELDVKPLSPPISNRRTSLFQSKSKEKDVDKRNKTTPTIRAPALKSRAKSLASSIAEGRAATPVSRGATPVIGGTEEEPFGATGENVGGNGKVAMGKSGRFKKDKIAEKKALPVSITALIPEPSSTSRRALTKEPFSQQTSDEEEPPEAEPWTKVGRKTLQSQTQSKLKDRGPSVPPTKESQSDNEPLKKRAITRRDLDCDLMAEGETEKPQNKLTKKTTRKSTIKVTTSPQEKRVRAVPMRRPEPTLRPEEYHSQGSRLNQRDVIDLPSFVTVKGVANPRRSKANKMIAQFDDEDDDEQVQELEEEDDEGPQAKKRGGRPTRGTAGQDNDRNKKQKHISRSQPDGSNSHSNSDRSSDSDHPPTKRDKVSSKIKTETVTNSKAIKAKPKAQSKTRKNKSYRLESSEDEEASADNQTSEPHFDLTSDSDPEKDVKRGIKLTTGRELLTATVSSRSTKTKAQTKEISSSGRPSIYSRPSKKCKRMSENESEGEDEEENKRPPPKRTKRAQSSIKRKRDDTPGNEEESETSQPSPKLVKVTRKGPGKTMKKGKMENKREEMKAEEEPLKISDLLSGISKAMRKRVNTRSRMR
ncbi:hypothetical protein D1P53_005434 [Cryptococcus gattii VGV]|nr:hypothetical protein D1P53_005434 [Cryptococcus gattii VGV]